MDITKMSKEDFLAVPERTSFNDNIGLFYSLVIIPMDYLHDSGFRCMDFVAVDITGEPICRLSGCSDVINFDGLGGYGKEFVPGEKSRPIEGWRIDCLPCGLLRIFCNGWIEAGHAISDFSIYWHDNRERQ